MASARGTMGCGTLATPAGQHLVAIGVGGLGQ
jgi:hypothetical protein